MNYTPKHKDITMRAIYAFLLLFAMVISNTGTGLTRTLLLSASIVMLVMGAYLFLRYELTTFSYIILDTDSGKEFFIDKAVGKRNGYVCFYPLKDAVELLTYTDKTKKELKEKYSKIYIYNYCHNRFKAERQILVFKNDGYYDAVIIELNEYRDYVQGQINESKRKIDEE